MSTTTPPGLDASSMSPIEAFVISLLATWRVSHLVWAEDGPWSLMANARAHAARHGWRVLDCFYCLSLWVALPIALCTVLGLNEQPVVWHVILQWLALSGSAVLLERVTAAMAAPTTATWHDDAAAGSREPGTQIGRAHV